MSVRPSCFSMANISRSSNFKHQVDKAIIFSLLFGNVLISQNLKKQTSIRLKLHHDVCEQKRHTKPTTLRVTGMVGIDYKVLDTRHIFYSFSNGDTVDHKPDPSGESVPCALCGRGAAGGWALHRHPVRSRSERSRQPGVLREARRDGGTSVPRHCHRPPTKTAQGRPGPRRNRGVFLKRAAPPPEAREARQPAAGSPAAPAPAGHTAWGQPHRQEGPREVIRPHPPRRDFRP